MLVIFLVGLVTIQLLPGNLYAQKSRRGYAAPSDSKADTTAAQTGTAQTGPGTRNMEAEGVKYIRMAAERGSRTAQFSLGLCYAEGHVVTKDAKEAVKWYTKAAEQGYSEAQYNLGMCYDQGHGVAKNPEEALKWCRLAASQGETDAQEFIRTHDQTDSSNIGTKTTRTAKVAKSSASSELDTSSQQGGVRKASAQANESNANQPTQRKYSALELVTLGIRYEKGDGLPPDIDKANQLYQKACELGCGEGYNRLGESYLHGKGVQEDIYKANALFRKAGDLGCGEGYNSLARNYFFGEGVPKNLSQAVELFQKAGDLGFGEGYTNLGLAFNSGTGVPQDYGRANAYFLKAGALGSGSGYNMLAISYVQGHGVNQDLAQSNLLFERAGNMGEARGFENLAISYQYGRGVARDAAKAKEFETKALALGNKVKTQNGGGMTDAEALQKIKDDPGALARSFFSGLLKELTTHNPEKEPSAEEPLGPFDNPWRDAGDGTMYRYDGITGVRMTKMK